MAFYFDFTPFSLEGAGRVYQKGAAFNSNYFLAIHVFFFDDIVSPAGFFVFIGNKFECKAELFFEVFMCLQAVPGNAKNPGFSPAKFPI